MKIVTENIIDIKFSGQEIFMLKTFSWNSQSVYTFIQTLDFPKISKAVYIDTSDFSIPPIAGMFYKILFYEGYIPTLDYLRQRYFLEYMQSIRQIGKKSVTARIARAYPSILRDLHFVLLCRDSGYFQEVKYSLNMDYFEGIDVYIKYENTDFGIRLMVNTPRSLVFNNKKIENRKGTWNTKIINVTHNLEEKYKVGNIFLYHKEHVENLLKQIKKMLTKD